MRVIKFFCNNSNTTVNNNVFVLQWYEHGILYVEVLTEDANGCDPFRYHSLKPNIIKTYIVVQVKKWVSLVKLSSWQASTLRRFQVLKVWPQWKMGFSAIICNVTLLPLKKHSFSLLFFKPIHLVPMFQVVITVICYTMIKLCKPSPQNMLCQMFFKVT